MFDLTAAQAALRAQLPAVNNEIQRLEGELQKQRRIRHGILVALGEVQPQRPPGEWGPAEQRVLAALERHELPWKSHLPRGITENLARELGLSYSYVRQCLTRLRKVG